MTQRPPSQARSLAVFFLPYILHHVRLEEAHMRKLFGAHFTAYLRRTARLVLGIY